MVALEAVVSLLGLIVIGMAGYIWVQNAGAVKSLAEEVSKGAEACERTARLVDRLEERLDNHLRWAGEAFTPTGQHRPNRPHPAGG